MDDTGFHGFQTQPPRIPASEAEGNASQQNLDNVIDNLNAASNSFQSGMKYIPEDTPSSNIEEQTTRERFEDTTTDKDMSKASSPFEAEDTTEEKRPPSQTQH